MKQLFTFISLLLVFTCANAQFLKKDSYQGFNLQASTVFSDTLAVMENKVLRFFDVSDPDNITLLPASVQSPSDATEFEKVDNYLFYINSWQPPHFVTVNLASRPNPTIEGELTLSGPAYALAVTDTVAYVSTVSSSYDFYKIDIRDRNNPVKVDSLDIGTGYGITIIDNYAYVMQYGSTKVLDLNSFTSVKTITYEGRHAIPNADSTVLFISSDNYEINAFDITDRVNPQLLNSYTVPNYLAGRLVSHGEYIFQMSDTPLRLGAYKINGNSLETAGEFTDFDSYEGYIHFISNKGNQIYVTTSDILQVVEFDPTPLAVKMSNLNSGEIFPNPVEDIITINSLLQGNGKYAIYDLQGHLYKTGEIHSINNFKLDVSTLTSGLFYIEVSNENNREILNFLKK